MNNTKRVEAIVKMMRSSAAAKRNDRGWVELSIPRVGKVFAHIMPADVAAKLGVNEVWARVGSPDLDAVEFRGTAVAVATQLVEKCLKAPSAEVSRIADAIVARKFQGYRQEEIAAALGCNDNTAFAAVDFLIDRGLASMAPNGAGLCL